MRDMPPIDMDADSLGPPLGPGLGSCRAALLADGSVLRAWCHAANIGRIALALAEHDIGDMDDCSINDPIVSIIDGGEPAHGRCHVIESLMRVRRVSQVKSCGDDFAPRLHG
jgi:hypothetical protein